MPHDSRGKPLAKGDRVTFRAVATDVFANESACNASFTIEIPAGVPETYGPMFSCNTRLCEKVEGPGLAARAGHPLTARLSDLTIPPAFKAGLITLFEKYGPEALADVIGMLEAQFPAYAPLLELAKAEALSLIPAPPAGA